MKAMPKSLGGNGGGYWCQLTLLRLEMFTEVENAGWTAMERNQLVSVRRPI
jgi:hypothetical protein